MDNQQLYHLNGEHLFNRFSYKRWSSETILKRSRAQESSKSKGEEIPKI